MNDLWHRGEWRERLKKSQSIWITACILVSLLLVLMVALNSGFAYREAQSYVERRTGLELQAGSSRLTLMPFGLLLSDVKVLSRDGTGRQIVSAPAATIPMQWRSLLTRKLRPSEILIERPVINLAIDSNGSPGWSGKGDAIDQAVAQNSVRGEPLKISFRDGTLRVLDERNGQSFEVPQITADISLDRTGTLDLAGTAAIANQFTRVEAHIASLPRLSEDGTPFDLSLNAPALTASFSGRLSLQGALSLAGTFSAETSNMASLLRWTGREKVPEALALPATAKGPINLSGASFHSSDVTMTAGDMTFKGKLGLDMSTAVPAITGQLSTDALKLVPIPAPVDAPDASVATAPVAKKLDFSPLKQVDAELTLSAFSATIGPLALGTTTLTIQGKAGQYDIGLAETSMFSGTGSATLHLDGSSDTPQAGLIFSATSVDFGKVLTAAGVADWINGAGNVSMDVRASGMTSEEMISTLEGKASLALPRGGVKGFDVAASIQRAASAIAEGWTSSASASTAITNLQADFNLRDGIATASEAVATLAGVDVAMTGDIDFLRRAVDLRLSPSASGSGVPLAIHVVGPWEKPKLKADVSEVLGIPGAEVDGKDVQKAAKKAKKFLKKVIGN